MNPNTLNQTIQFFTDTATLAIFDPTTIAERIDDNPDWWCGNFSELKELNQGLISLVSLIDDGYYKIRVTNEALTQDEQDFSRSLIGPLGVTSKSGKVFIGKGEYLPGGGYSTSPEETSSNDGKFIELPVGDYDLFFYYVDAVDYASPEFAESLPTIVIVVTPRIHHFLGVATEPRIDLFTETFLFPSARNASKLKPALHKKIRAKVFKSERTASGLALHPDGSWPSSYHGFEVILEDMSQVQWKDKILIKTTRLDQENKIIYAELVEKSTPSA